MLILIKNPEVYSPEYTGKKDILITGNKTGFIRDEIKIPADFVPIKVIDGKGKYIVPGFLDCHVHITGGGGEGGFKTRTPEIRAEDIFKYGITTVIGCLGTDGITRTMTNLLAKAKALEEEGLTTYVYTGSYQIPVRTITGKIEDDLILFDKIIGVGEIALSDHRSSQPSVEDVAKIAGAARVGGILSGKGGIVNIHLGDGKRGLSFLKETVEKTEIPFSQFLPTHVGRNPRLFEEAVEYARNGGFVDFTTSTTEQFLQEGEVKCSKGLKIMLEWGVNPSHITFSSDGQGSLPDFDEKGNFKGLTVASCSSLFEEVKDAVREEKIDMAVALKVITSNPADLLKLHGKGYIKEGKDADMVILNKKDLTIETVIAGGKVLFQI